MDQDAKRMALDAGYRHVQTTGGLAGPVRWTVLEIRGRDRAAWLHNFCTQEIKQLPAGQCREAFVLDAKGRTIGQIVVGAWPDRLRISAPGDQRQVLVPHFQKYVIREDVQIVDRTGEQLVYLVAAPDVALPGRFAPAGAVKYLERNAAFEMPLDGAVVDWLGVDWFGGPAWLAHVPAAQQPVWDTCASAASLDRVPESVFDALRIENTVPWFGIDFGPDNLPQEIGRDRQAISFHKGCYLGQETVARIDALGHVNRQFVLVQLLPSDTASPKLPSAPEPIWAGDRQIGTVTSVTWSPARSAFIGLAIVRRANLDDPSPWTCGGHAIQRAAVACR